MGKPKVFCIGFQKTGTTSLAAALRRLDYRVASIFGRDFSFAELRRSYVQRGLAIAGGHDAVEDMPWPLMYRALDETFPGSKFILTWRETDRWLASICDHFGTSPAVLQQLTYGEDAPFPVGHEDRYRETYELHNAEVRAYFRHRPDDLLQMNLSHGDGWAALCTFLGEPIPPEPFPHVNNAERRKSISHRIKRKVKRIFWNRAAFP